MSHGHSSIRPQSGWRYGWLAIAAVLVCNRSPAKADDTRVDFQPLLKRFCYECHGNDEIEANVNLKQMVATRDFVAHFKTWELALRKLEQNRMPPKEALQPSDAERQRLVNLIRTELAESALRNAGDPGPVVLRRLTSAEYAYSIQDLTGLDLKLDRAFVSDAVGGEGFTNAGGAQFMQDSTLERYLEAAKQVADHAVIGAGPLAFSADPGETGRELFAIRRIQQIYREHGFRTAAGEGAEPFGLDLYPRAFLVAWRYRFRDELGLGDTTLERLAHDERLSARFCRHICDVLNGPASAFPLSEIVARWNRVQPPDTTDPLHTKARSDMDSLARDLREWQSMLAAAAGDEEEASVLTAGEIEVNARHSFTADIDWADGATTATFELSVTSASVEPAAGSFVTWKNPRLRFRREDNRREPFKPLESFLSSDTKQRLALGRHPAGNPIGADEFVLGGDTLVPVLLLIPPGMSSAQLMVDVELDTERGADRIVRCRIADGQVEGETAAEFGASSTLLANPASPAVAAWRAGVAEFARRLPEVSHREPAPSDRDPIPPPFDNTYNKPERNHFHYAIKYHRDDQFLVEHILDDTTRRELDRAWTDLLTSFEYHDANLRFIAKRFGIDLTKLQIAELTESTIERLPAEPREFVQRLHQEYATMRDAVGAAEPSHVDDALQLAERAWRRPLTRDDERRLRQFYATIRHDSELSHAQAVRALVARVLVAPEFLYRSEAARVNGVRTSADQSDNDAHSIVQPLTDWELAARLSYFIWSSLPDDDLRQLAASGRLRDQLPAQTRRMLADPKARRLATEFFGQWFGFYRFDEIRGIDTGRFPEFDESLRAALYDEAKSFFEHIVREDRPVGEILFADYSFLNERLAQHYGIAATKLSARQTVRVANLAEHRRGGLLGLGAVHAVTSAPLRTSAVKRGDWVLRRVVGTPVPSPPADAGSIAADDLLADGLTVRRRLEAHRTDPSCVNCHARIDPLGFALEQFDPIGRWRDQYRDGQPIDLSGTLSDGTDINGLDGLKRYLRRELPQFERTLATKLLGYALGRAEIASDRRLIDEMQVELTRDDRFSNLVVRVVTSRQFGYRRQESAVSSD